MKRFVVTGLVLAMGFAATPATAGPVFGAASFDQSLTLGNANNTNVLAGVTYYNGGYTSVRTTGLLTRYDNVGTITSGPVANSPSAALRSIFIDGSGNELVRQANSGTLYKQSGAENAFVASSTTLSGLLGTAQVVFSLALNQYVANNNRTLNFFRLDGTLARTLALDATSSLGSIAIFGDYGINETGGVLRAFDLTTGAVVDQATLTGTLNVSYADTYGQGYANGYFFAAGATTGPTWQSITPPKRCAKRSPPGRRPPATPRRGAPKGCSAWPCECPPIRRPGRRSARRSCRL